MPIVTHVIPFFPRSFIAEMGFYVNALGRAISAREAGSNKQSASKSCALSLVRQLFHLGVIQAFEGTLKKANRDVDRLKPVDVALSPETEARLVECLKAWKLPAVDADHTKLGEGLRTVVKFCLD